MADTSLAQRWQALLDSQGRVRIRAAATTLGVSEAELLATGLKSEVQRLQPRWKDLIQAISEAGPVMALTRNNWAVLEKTGRFEQLRLEGPVGIAVGTMINLRMLFEQWHAGFAVITPRKDGSRLRSFQIFDGHGDAILKLYLREDDQVGDFERICADFDGSNLDAPRYSPAPTPPTPSAPDDSFDSGAFQTAWLDQTDTHEFDAMLQAHGFDRLTALRYAPADHAWQLPTDVLETLLERIRDEKLPFLLFVANRGNVQIHGGPIENLKRMHGFMNILDGADLNLHFLEKGVHEVWVVRKCTDAGIITSVEFYQEDGGIIAQFFGMHKQGDPEGDQWPKFVDALPKS